MRIGKVAAGLLLLTVLVVSLELYAGITVLKNGHLLDGKILHNDDTTLLLRYRYGTLTLSKTFVDRVIALSDDPGYGSQSLPPADEELYRLENLFLKTSDADSLVAQKPPDKEKEAEYFRKFKTLQQTLKKEKWELSLDIPAGFEKSGNKDLLIFQAPGDSPAACICISALETPPVGLFKQAELSETAAWAYLDKFSHVYSVARKSVKSENGECVILSTYGPGSQMISQLVLHRTPDYTFVVSFFLPRKLYEEYRAVFYVCMDSIRLKETGK